MYIHIHHTSKPVCVSFQNIQTQTSAVCGTAMTAPRRNTRDPLTCQIRIHMAPWKSLVLSRSPKIAAEIFWAPGVPRLRTLSWISILARANFSLFETFQKKDSSVSANPEYLRHVQSFVNVSVVWRHVEDGMGWGGVGKTWGRLFTSTLQMVQVKFHSSCVHDWCYVVVGGHGDVLNLHNWCYAVGYAHTWC